MATNIRSIGSLSRDYTSIPAWEADTDNDLVAAGNIEIGEVYDDSVITSAINFQFAGAVTNAANYRVLRAASGHEFDFATNTGVRIEYSGSIRAIFLNENFFRFGGGISVEVVSGAGNATEGIEVQSGKTDITVFSCIVRGNHLAGSSQSCMGIVVEDSCHRTTIRNCIIVGGVNKGWSRGINMGNSNDCEVRNCIVHKLHPDGSPLTKGFSGHTTATGNFARNVVVCDTLNNDWDADNTTCENCGTSDGSGTGVGLVTGVVAANEWTDAGALDYTVKDASSKLYEAGKTLTPTEEYRFRTHNHGDATGTWNIGPYDGIGVGGGAGVTMTIDPVAVSLAVAAPTAVASALMTPTPVSVALAVEAPAAAAQATMVPAAVPISLQVEPPTMTHAVTAEIDPVPLTLSVVTPAVTTTARMTIDPIPITTTVEAPAATAEATQTIAPVDLELQVVAPASSGSNQGSTIDPPVALTLTVEAPAAAASASMEATPVPLQLTVEAPEARGTVTATIEPVPLQLAVEAPAAAASATMEPTPVELQLQVVDLAASHFEWATPDPVLLSLLVEAPAAAAAATMEITPVPLTLTVEAPFASDAAGGTMTIEPVVLTLSVATPTIYEGDPMPVSAPPGWDLTDLPGLRGFWEAGPGKVNLETKNGPFGELIKRIRDQSDAGNDLVSRNGEFEPGTREGITIGAWSTTEWTIALHRFPGGDHFGNAMFVEEGRILLPGRFSLLCVLSASRYGGRTDATLGHSASHFVAMKQPSAEGVPDGEIAITIKGTRRTLSTSFTGGIGLLEIHRSGDGSLTCVWNTVDITTGAPSNSDDFRFNGFGNDKTGSDQFDDYMFALAVVKGRMSQYALDVTRDQLKQKWGLPY